MTQQDMQMYLAGRLQDQIASAQFLQSMQQYIQNAPTFGQQALQQSQQFQGSQVPVPSLTGNTGRVTYRQAGNALIGSNGVTYRYVGSSVIGSDGTKCQIVGENIVCSN